MGKLDYYVAFALNGNTLQGVWAGTTGKFDQVPVKDVLQFEQEYLSYLKHNTKVLDVIAETGQFSADTQKAAEDALEAFRHQYSGSDGASLASGDQAAKAIAEEDLSHEQIVVQKKRG